MNRLSEFEIAGRKYPLNFSMKAARMFSERYGGLDNIDSAFDGENVDAMLGEVVWLLSVLMEQGAAYKRIVDGETVDVLSPEDLEVVLGMADIQGLKGRVLGAMVGGMEREVEIDSKNAETTQSD